MMRRALPIAALVVVAGLAVGAVVSSLGGGSGGGGPARTTATRTAARAPASTEPALCSSKIADATLGKISGVQAIEISGLTASRTQAGLLWAIEDSGNSARLIAVRDSGEAAGTVTVAGAQNTDWEDIATGPSPDGGAFLYIADIGDNDAQRSGIAVWRVPEPSPDDSATATADRIDLSYPDGAHDAETLLVDPRSRALVVVTKATGGDSRMYAGNAPPSGGGSVKLRDAGALDFGLGGLATGGSITRSGALAAIRTYSGASVWARRAGEPLTTALKRPSCEAKVNLAGEGQGESLALVASGRAFFTVAEGADPPLRRYRAAG
jgi:hypothetical protein